MEKRELEAENIKLKREIEEIKEELVDAYRLNKELITRLMGKGGESVDRPGTISKVAGQE